MLINKIKNRISEAATEACGYSPLTKVVSEEEINRILEQESGWIPCSERLPESYSADTEKPQTNADRIRSMTDEELLDFLCSIETYEQCSVKTIEGGVAMCSVTEVEQWLKAESEG